jgi:HlyD family secretion protein
MKKILIAVSVVVLLGIGVSAVLLRGGGADSASQAPTAIPVVEEEQLVAEARVVPAQNVELSLPNGGVVAKLLVAEGDRVQAGQTLLQLDQARAQAEVAQAEAQLARAQAAFEQVGGGATPPEIAAAEAELRAAQAQLRQTEGNVTPADQAAAAAQLQQARAHLAELQAGSKSTDLRAAEATLAQSQANLTTQRDQLSAAKTNAQFQMQQRVNDLTKAQAEYATAKRNWDYAQETGKDPNAVIDPTTGKKTHLKLDDRQKQQYHDAYVQAEAAMHSADTAIQQAQVAYDAARQAEVSGIQVAEQQVASAAASLDKLRGEQRGGALDAAQASVDQAQASLDKLHTGASKYELAMAAAEVQSAQATLKLAQVTLSETELRAPFAGVVAALNLKAGEYVAPGAPVVQVADLETWQLETTDLTELNIARVREDSQAAVTFDAIPDLELLGRVSHIRALGENKQGDITYTITIKLDRQDPRLRWNMTATVAMAQ